MGTLSKDMYSVAPVCVGPSFCLDGGSIDSSTISLPRTMRIRILANPSYWGFAGTPHDNVLVSGYCTYNQGHFDFFDGFQPDYEIEKICGLTSHGVFQNEQRPDIGYRSVWDEDASIHYNGTVGNDVMRGGAEVYLFDRTAVQNTDQSSCDTSNPLEVFKKSPDQFGYGNKILFNDKIYKNMTGGWRGKDSNYCYSSGLINDMRNVCCSGSGLGGEGPKQHIHLDGHFGDFWDQAQQRYLAPQYAKEQACQPDGTIPKEYQGKLVSLTRDTGVSPYIQATLSYYTVAASALRNGQQILLVESGHTYDQSPYLIYNVSHGSNTTAYLLGSNGTGNISYSGVSDTWLALNTIDPQSCCGAAALGVDDLTKDMARQPNYHTDIPKIFNNAKNKLYSNRDKYQTGDPRRDFSYIQASGSGVVYTENGQPVYPRELAYFGPWYDLDPIDDALRYENDSQTITHKNTTCYTKSQTLQLFPDCLTQYYRYKDCDQVDRYYQTNVPRLAVVYRPCNYDQPCSFSGSMPLTAGASGHPSSISDLRRGFGGQEVVMYLNLGDAWGKEINRIPCSCDLPIPGTSPPSVVTIPSPITYPCFPKFDLEPSGYGCLDPLWYNYARNRLGLTVDNPTCGVPFMNACYVKQPYPTYGFIRNLCGHESQDRKTVIRSLAEREHTGAFRDITPTGGLSSTEPLYVNFIVPSDSIGSGFPVGDCSDGIGPGDVAYTGGGNTFQYGACISGNKPYWGLTDSDGRLAYPYFRTKVSTTTVPCSTGIMSYINYDDPISFSGGFPTSGVPFLIEIDHEDYCVGCSTTNLELKDYTITLNSLPAKYYHAGGTYPEGSYHELSYKYGYNHCRYPGAALTPTYNSTADTWSINLCGESVPYNPSFDNGIASPYVGETAECLDGTTTVLRVHPLEGTNVPKYWSTSGANNSYVQLSGCGYSIPSPSFELNGDVNGTLSDVFDDFNVYFASRMSCLSSLHSYDGLFGADWSSSEGLETFYGCGGCSHSYPATAGKPDIDLDFWYVSKKNSWIFDRLLDEQIANHYEFLNEGATRGHFTGFNGKSSAGAGPVYLGVPSNCTTAGGDAGIFVNGTCYPLINGEPLPQGASYPYCCSLPPGLEEEATYRGDGTNPCTFFAGQRIIRGLVGSTLESYGCQGSRIILYGKKETTTPSTAGEGGGFLLLGAYSQYNNACYQCCDAGADDCFQTRQTAATDLNFTYAMGATRDSNGLASGCVGSAPFGCPVECDDFVHGCVGPCEAYSLSECWDKGPCCRDTSINPDTGEVERRQGEFYHASCWTDEPLDIIGEFTYYDFSASQTGIYGAGCADGWYGWLNVSHFHTLDGDFGQDSFCSILPNVILQWEGIGLKGLGDIGPLPFGESIAFRYDQINTGNTYSFQKKSICDFDTSVNATIEVDSEFILPARNVERGQDVHLNPINCQVTMGPTGSPVNVGSTCIKPIPFNTATEIGSGGSFKVDVVKPACFPEIMTVHKIVCQSGGIYALHVSREYYEHDRNVYTVDAYIDSTTNLLVANRKRLYGRIDGGGEITRYTCGSGRNSYDIATQCGSDCVAGDTMDYYGLLPKMAETDGVTPCFPPTCVTGVLPFIKSLCANYEKNGEFTGGIGIGGSGYFQVGNTGAGLGNLNFVIQNPGSGYYAGLYNSGTDVVSITGCAFGVFDQPACVNLTLSVYPNDGYLKCFNPATQSLVNNTGQCSNQYFIYSGTLGFTDCGGGSGGFTSGIYPISFRACDSSFSTDCELSNATCDGGSPQFYPNLYNGGNGTGLWNFYNLFYDSGYLGGLALDDADPDDNVWFKPDRPDDRQPPFPFNIQFDAAPKHGRLTYNRKKSNQIPLAEIIPFSESTGLKNLHSCIQDYTSCGGSFFCNKEFFPRRSYLAGTKLAKFAPFSICTQNGEKGYGGWLDGHISDDFINTLTESTLEEHSQESWLDPCKDGATCDLLYNIGINDTVIYVSGDITPLLGARHPYFLLSDPYNNSTAPPCFGLDSGCYNGLPTHNTATIAGIDAQTFETGDEDTYSEMKQSGCLLEPFKIFCDVQCCSERLGHPGTSDPTYLSWIIQGIPAGVAKGWISGYETGEGGFCEGTNCDNRWLYRRELPDGMSMALIPWWDFQCGSGGCVNPEGWYFFACPNEAPLSSCSSMGNTVGVLYNNKYYLIWDGVTPISADPTYSGCLPVVGCNPSITGLSKYDSPSFCELVLETLYVGNGSQYYINDLAPPTASGVEGLGVASCTGVANFLLNLGCIQQTNVNECPYPSLVKVSVTE